MEGKAAILKEIAKNLVGLADSLEKLAESELPPKVEEPKPPAVTLEQVRSTLASLSAEGKTAQVKNLIEKYGATKLSEVDPVHYAGLLEEAKNAS